MCYLIKMVVLLKIFVQLSFRSHSYLLHVDRIMRDLSISFVILFKAICRILRKLVFRMSLRRILGIVLLLASLINYPSMITYMLNNLKGNVILTANYNNRKAHVNNRHKNQVHPKNTILRRQQTLSTLTLRKAKRS